MSKLKPQRDPRGHSLRIYSDVFDSPAFAALSPHDVLAYLALMRELKGYNNGDLSLPLSRAKGCGIGHHLTLARSLRALCAVGLVAITRKGGCTKGGQRLPTLYRMTDRECYDIPAKHLGAMRETHDWKRVTDTRHGLSLIAAAELSAKAVTEKLKTLGHGVTMAEKGSKPLPMRAAAEFCNDGEKAIHRTPHVPPLYVYQSVGQTACIGEHGTYQQLTAKPAHLFTRLMNKQRATH